MDFSKDFTFLISIYKYPYAEMCALSIKHFYPNVKLIVAFDKKEEYSSTREKFFKQLPNTHIMTQERHPLYAFSGHGFQLDRMLNSGVVETPYFVVVDDDVFMHEKGLLGYFSNLIKKKDAKVIAALQCNYADIPVSHRSMRFHPFCMCLNTNTYHKYDMTFRVVYSWEWQELFPQYINDNSLHYDTATLIFFDVIKHKINCYAPMLNQFANYIHHPGSTSWGRIGVHFSLMDHCKEDLIVPDLSMLETAHEGVRNANDDYYYKLSKFVRKYQKMNDEEKKELKILDIGLKERKKYVFFS